MKTKLLTLILIYMYFFNSSFAQNSFEGLVKFSVASPEDTLAMDYFVSDNMYRFEFESEENFTMIVSQNKFLLLMPEEKSYMELPLDLLTMTDDSSGELYDEQEVEDVDEFRTGEKKKILGYNCEKISFRDEEGIIDVWVTRELGNFFFMDNPMADDGSSIFSKFNDLGLFPLILEATDSDGNFLIHLEAKEIKRMDLEDGVFSVPADYVKMEMPGFNYNKE